MPFSDAPLFMVFLADVATSGGGAANSVAPCASPCVGGAFFSRCRRKTSLTNCRLPIYTCRCRQSILSMGGGICSHCRSEVLNGGGEVPAQGATSTATYGEAIGCLVAPRRPS